MSTIGINGSHDLGGVLLQEEGKGSSESSAKIDMTDKPNSYWETSIHALLVTLASKQPALATTDELRRCVEALEPEAYKTWGYYDKWSVALANICLERGVITQAELDAELNGDSPHVAENATPVYKVGDVVRVKSEDSRLRWRRPHIRCPGYIYGQVGIVEEYVGPFHDPFLLAFQCKGAKQHLYRISFDMKDLWSKTGAAAHSGSIPAEGSDRIQADIYEGWLEPFAPTKTVCNAHAHEHAHHEAAHTHDEHGEHGHAHAHKHADSAATESLPTPPSHGHSEHAHEHAHAHAHAHAHNHTDGHKHDDHCSHEAPQNGTHEAHAGKHCGHAHGHDEHSEHEAAKEHAHEHAHEHGHDGEHSAHGHGDAHHHHHAGEAAETHEHGHDHGHTHEGRYEVECVAVDRESANADRPGKVVGEALLRLLYKKNVVTQAEIHKNIEALEMANTSMKGADLVVYAWKDPAFKERLIADARKAALEFGMATSNQNATTILRVVANSPMVHNVIVCTLCSCYPVGLLGFSPAWYKSRAYRSRVVFEPRKVLSEFGLHVPANVTVKVHDSTADCRYLVLPMPPAFLTEADIARMTHGELKALVSRDSMIGVAVL